MSGVGVKTLLNDPPKQAAGDSREFTPLETLLEQADVITVHTPLTVDGEFPTHHLINDHVLTNLRPDQILINAARGPIVDNAALKVRLQKGDGFTAVLDVFEYEPEVDMTLLPLLAFATPHIAGYGLEGKARGTTMIYNSYCEFLGVNKTAQASELLPIAPLPQVHLSRQWDEATLFSLTQLIYDVRKDDALFRRVMPKEGAFDAMRKQYWDRREYSALTLVGDATCELAPLAKLGFNIEVKQ